MIYYLKYTPKGQQNSRGVVVFDIEYYKERSDKDEDLWNSEISCLPCVEGLSIFLKDKLIEPGFNIKQFIADAIKIQEVRGLLYENMWEGQSNRPKPAKDADNFHYNIFGKVIENLFEEFTKKYGMWISRD